MGIEQRRHQRYQVHLAITYASAEEFVLDYIENLSIGGLFVAGQREFQLLKEEEVVINLPGQGTWRVRAKPVFVLTAEAASRVGKQPGAGMEITFKPAGFDEALLGYLVRLGRRRDVAVMIDAASGAKLIAEAGYQVMALAPVASIVSAISNASAPVVAVIVPSAVLPAYTEVLRRVLGDVVFGVTGPGQVPDVVARIDSLL